MVKRMTAVLFALRNRHFLALDGLICLMTPALALALRTEQFVAIARYGTSLFVVTLVFLVTKLAVFYPLGLYRQFWRYASVDDLARITTAGFIAFGIQLLAFFGILRPFGLIAAGFPRSVPIIESLIALVAIGGIRYSVRLGERARQHAQRLENTAGTGTRTWPVVVMGAGDAGVMIVRELQRNPQVGFEVVGFLDDNPDKHGHAIHGIPVLGDRNAIPRVVRERDVRRVIIAMPTAPGKEIRSIVEICDQADVRTKIIPGVYELLTGTVSVNQLRDVEIEDLLRREPRQTDITGVEAVLRDSCVLVTGGGGSIGSELCRQILRCSPAELILLGHGETSVFKAHKELKALQVSLHSTCTIRPVIADIRFPDRIQATLEQYRPEIVFHAAAHKHVPLMEHNPAEAITNNVVGTRNLLDASQATGVERFVMISTDKAVNPTSIMGASKRIAELLVHRAAIATGKAYSAVRFGNVLGSRGSVVNIFKQQIADGGPITVTHPEMRRYFMSIPEAVQLVLQASALGQGGEVFVLDMGEPVKIVDLARDLVELSGLTVGRDIDIIFTGIRPGEKLFEELFMDDETYERTIHEEIYLATNASTFIPDYFDETLDDLEAAAWRNEPAAIREALHVLVPDLGASANGTSTQQTATAAASVVHAGA